jgi:hypothetical protein
VKYASYIEKSCTFAAIKLAIWWLKPPDVRESGENPELYLQL